ncbi:clostripain-related cysteine peptidase [Desulfatibacillum aliphaticivorans]|uniref:clostripain-related cysteine peptidase n=1 Tax=Desulfatibacillum aliphaticivorans TaxID=218208 RepID=UPI0004162AFA|nr:clostripain-related cysteine peptidase [Desulfatibacillum aliphaticivorans]
MFKIFPARLPLILIPIFFFAIISSSWAAATAQFSGAYFTAKQSNLGMPVLLKAQLVDASGDPIPEAIVYFDIYHDGAWHVINGDDGGCITDSTGAANVYYYVDPTLSVGSHQIRARFDGDAKSDSAVLDQTLTTNKAEITFALYLNGDNDLEPHAMDDFYTELYPHGVNNNVNFIVLFDGYGRVYVDDGYWDGTRMFIVTPESVASQTYLYQEWGEQNMGDQSTLQAFTETAFKDFPAQNNVLVIWDHGNGWYSQPETKTLTKDNANAITIGAHVELPIPHQTAARLASKKAVASMAAEEDMAVKGVSYDYPANDYLGLTELSGALKQAGVIVDVLAMDACLMGSVEVAYEVKDVANFFVGSMETVPLDGFDYDDLGNRIAMGNCSTARDMAYQMVESYGNFYSDYIYQCTLSAWDLKEMASVFSALENLSTTFLAHMHSIRDIYFTAATREATSLIDDSHCYDLGSLAHHIQEEMPNHMVCDAALALKNELEGAARVNYWLHSSTIRTGYTRPYSDMTAMTGLSIYWPPPLEFNPHYVDERALSFASQSWNKFIRLDYDHTPPSPDGPVEWVRAPSALSESAITMEIFSATDQFVITYNGQTYYLDNTVYYQFEPYSITGGTGATWSGNRYTSTVYTDDGLEPNHEYLYTAFAHDGAGHRTDRIDGAYAVTLARTPGPGDFSATNENEILVVWSPNGNPDHTEYYCENIGTGDVSGWITQTQWSNSGLASDQFYKFRVKAKNLDGVETEWKSLGNACLGTCPGNVNKDYRIDVADAILCLQVAAGLTPEGMDKNTAIDAELQVGLDEALYILQIESEFR